MTHVRAVVAIPVRDEAERIGACLAALTASQTVRPDAVVLAINNTSDGTEALVHAMRPGLPAPVHVLVRDFPPEAACAGAARRLAMEHAATLLGEAGGGVLLTTDADGQVPPGWVQANLAALGQGADAVAGRAVLHADEADAIPARLHEDDARECAYAAALDELAWLVDPEPWDPWPRHTEHSGASIAVTLAAYRRAGGMPAAHIAEDRAFFAALRAVDARIRHAPDIVVTVSGRTVGRAEGGMADTIRRRLTTADPYLDTALEPAACLLQRVRARRMFREAFHGAARRIEHLAACLVVPPATVEAALAAEHCGRGWAALEGASETLRRRPVQAARVTEEIAAALRLIAAERVAGCRQAALL